MFRTREKERIDEIIEEAVVVVEQTFCSNFKHYPHGEEAKSRAMVLIDMNLSKKQKYWLSKNTDKDWVSRRIEYWVYKNKLDKK